MPIATIVRGRQLSDARLAENAEIRQAAIKSARDADANLYNDRLQRVLADIAENGGIAVLNEKDYARAKRAILAALGRG